MNPGSSWNAGALVRFFGMSRVEAPTGTQAAAFDREAIQKKGVAESALMENAGRQSAHLISTLFPCGSVLVLVGPGNNGGDALICLRALVAWGRDARAMIVGDRPMPDALSHGWPESTVDIAQLSDEELTRTLGGYGVVVDGLLGTGTRGAPRGAFARVIRCLGEASVPVVALDVPTGVDADTRQVVGEAVKAHLTVAFGWPKLGALLHPGRSYVGRLIVVEIGFPPGADFGTQVLTPGWADSRRVQRPPVSHKNSVGSLCLMAGSQSMAGAAVLAAQAALRAGVGSVRICAPEDARPGVLEAVPEVVFVDADDPAAVGRAVRASRAVAVGPGMGIDEVAARRFGYLLEALGEQPVLLDADALTILAGKGASPIGTDLGALARRGPIVVTPHPGEMGRLVDALTDRVQQDRPGVARELAAKAGVVVLFKGTPSLVAAPDGQLLVDGQGSSDLAVAGMGDVLTGVVGALLAQQVNAYDAAGLGLYLSGRSAILAGLGMALTPSDVIAELPNALAEGFGDSDLRFPWVTLDQESSR